MKMKHPVKEVFLFFGLTLGLSYFVFWGPLAAFKITAISFVDSSTGPVWAVLLYIFGGFVPSAAGLFLTWRYEGKPGLNQIWRRLLQFKIGWKGYLAIFGAVIFGTAGQLAIIRLLGQNFDGTLFIRQLGSFLPLLILGPLSEEIGWRGYALDRLQAKWNPLVSSIILGVFWGAWHLPLFLIPGTSQHELAIPFVGFVFGVTMTSILYAWMHNNTQRSLWTAILFHWLFTYSVQVLSTGATRSTLFNWLEYVPYAVLALCVVVIWRSQMLANNKVLPNMKNSSMVEETIRTP